MNTELNLSEYKDWITDIEKTAIGYGFKKVPYINLELAAAHENDTALANDLIKRHVYLLSLGVKKIFWSGIKAAPDQHLTKDQRDNYFRKVTLIDGDGKLKPAYWSYMFLVKKLNNLDWNKTEVIKENDNGVFVYKFIVAGNPLWVVWSDTQEQRIKLEVSRDQEHLFVQSSLPSSSGKDIKTYKTAFPISSLEVIGGEIEIFASSVPVFISSVLK